MKVQTIHKIGGDTKKMNIRGPVSIVVEPCHKLEFFYLTLFP